MADQRTLRVVIVGNSDDAQQSFADLNDAGQETDSGFGDIGGKLDMLKGGAVAAGVALATMLPLAAIDQFNKALDETKVRGKISAQLGLTGADAAKAGHIAGQLYNNGFGESTADTGEGIKQVIQGLNMDINDVDLQPITEKVMGLGSTFDQDLGGVVNAVAKMVRTGLAPDFDTAMDVITVGFQKGNDKSEDFLDTLNEYSIQFKKMGIDGATASGLISQGLKAGARDGDLVADVIKEFSIRAIDGSAGAAAGYKALGLSAKDMTAQIAQGGKKANSGLQTVLDRLKGIEDPVKRNAAATALFGTQAEDLGDALFALDPGTAAKGMGDVAGATKKVNDAMGNNPGAKFDSFKRKLQTSVVNFLVEKVFPVFDKFKKIWDKTGKGAKDFSEHLSRFIQDAGKKVGEKLEEWAPKLIDGLTKLGQKVADWLVANPDVIIKLNLIAAGIILFLAALPVLLLVALTQAAVNICTTFIDKLVKGAKEKLPKWWQSMKDWVSAKGSSAGDWFKNLGTSIRGWFSGLWKNYVSKPVSDTWDRFITFCKGLPGRASRALSEKASTFSTAGRDFIHKLWDGAAAVGPWLVGKVRTLPGKMKAGLGNLGSLLASSGRNIVQGLWNGISGLGGWLAGKVRSFINDHVPAPIRNALGIHSPSRVMAEIGTWITKGLVKGMLGGTKSVEATSKKLHELVTKAFKDKKISKGRNKSIHDWLHKEDTKLWKLAKKREDIAKKLTKANEKLEGLKKSKADMGASITSAAKQGGFMGFMNTEEFGDNSANAIISRIKAKLAAIVSFRKNLNTLKKRGFGMGIINEMAQAGPEQGGQMAQALLNAGGAQVKEINSAYSAVNSQAKALGAQVSGQYYDAGIQSAQGLVNGLKKSQSKITDQIDKMAKAMVKALKKKLGIKSPSRVFRAQGQFTGDGFALGVKDRVSDVQAAVDELGSVRPDGRMAKRSMALEAKRAAQYGGTSAPTVYVTVQGNVTSEKALAKSVAGVVRDEIVRSGKRNGGRTGL